MLSTGRDHVVGTDHVGLYSFHRIELTGRNLFQSCCVEDIVNTLESPFDRMIISDITDIELQFLTCFGPLCLILMTHVILFLFITGNDADLFNTCTQESLCDRIAK